MFSYLRFRQIRERLILTHLGLLTPELKLSSEHCTLCIYDSKEKPSKQVQHISELISSFCEFEGAWTMPGSDLGFSASAACHSSSSGLNNMERCLLLSSLFCLLFLRAECSSQLLPKPPQQLPEDFYTWLIVSVTEDNNTQPLLIQGQFAAYSSTQNFSCRSSRSPRLHSR